MEAVPNQTCRRGIKVFFIMGLFQV